MTILEVGNTELDNADEIFRFIHYYDCDRVTDTDYHLVNRALRGFLKNTPYERNYRNAMGIERLLGDLTFEDVGYKHLVNPYSYYIDADDYISTNYMDAGDCHRISTELGEGQCLAPMDPLTYQLYRKFKNMSIDCSVEMSPSYEDFHGESYSSYGSLVLNYHKNLDMKSYLRSVRITIYHELTAHPRLLIYIRSHWSDVKDHNALWSEESKLGFRPIAITK